MHNYGPVSRLLLLPLHGGDEVDHSSSLGRDSDFRPAVEVEEPDVLGLLFLARRGGGKGPFNTASPVNADLKERRGNVLKIWGKKIHIPFLFFMIH